MSAITRKLQFFAHVHDELPAFHAGYLVLTFLAATLLNLGVFALLIVFHMALDVVKYREYHGLTWSLTIEAVVRESLLDITLLVLGLLFAVYLHNSVGMSTISGLLRAETTLVRTAAMILPKVKIIHHFLKVFSHVRHYLDCMDVRIQRGWSNLDITCFIFIVLTTVLIVFAGPLMHVPTDLIWSIVADEMIPGHIK